MSELSDLIVSSVLVADMTPKLMLLPVTIGTKKQTIKTQALLDCGASGEFMDSEFAKLHNIPLIKLSKPQITRNTDGTQNEQGVVTHKAVINLRVNGKEDLTTFFITGLGKDNIILGLTWLRKHNLIANWKEGTLRDRPHLSKVLRQKILASRKKVETINDKLTKGTPFEMKPLRTIEISNVEVSEKTPTLTIKDKPEIMMRKATVEEVPDEEAPTLVADRQPISDAIIKEIPPLVVDSEDSNEEPLYVVTLESEDEMIIAYIKGEPIISIFEKKDTLFTGDHDYLRYDYNKNSSGIRWISTSIRLARYTFRQDAWIRAKTSISQQLVHDKADSNPEKKKSLDDLLLKADHEYKSVFEKEASECFPES
jgi:predicted aspartyl protease